MPRHRITTILVTICLLPAAVFSATATTGSTVKEFETARLQSGLIIDHDCIDLSSVPSEWIEAAQDDVRVHYAHTSHGGQVTEGLQRIEDANDTHAVSIGYCSLPTDADTLCIYDGNGAESYITPDLYWEDAGGLTITQGTLDDNPTVTVSLWSWCTQMDYYSQEQAQDYLDAMAGLEAANPDVTFVYMTGNAQGTGEGGYNRWVNNALIRSYCTTNNKVLFDFEDLDCWSDGEHSTYEYVVDSTTYDVPVEHEDFNGDEAAHTTYTSCEQKGRAFWWMMASLAGWNAPNVTITTTTPTGPTDTQPMDYTVLAFTAALIGVLGLVGLVVSRLKH